MNEVSATPPLSEVEVSVGWSGASVAASRMFSAKLRDAVFLTERERSLSSRHG